MEKSYLDVIKDCLIDTNGTFKYILINLNCMGDKKTVVRGWKNLEFHADIYTKFLQDEDEKLFQIQTDVPGGGRIKIDSSKKSVYVYGYSQSYGMGNHEKACEIIKAYLGSDYTTSWSNEGY